MHRQLRRPCRCSTATASDRPADTIGGSSPAAPASAAARGRWTTPKARRQDDERQRDRRSAARRRARGRARSRPTPWKSTVSPRVLPSRLLPRRYAGAARCLQSRLPAAAGRHLDALDERRRHRMAGQRRARVPIAEALAFMEERAAAIRAGDGARMRLAARASALVHRRHQRRSGRAVQPARLSRLRGRPRRPLHLSRARASGSAM